MQELSQEIVETHEAFSNSDDGHGGFAFTEIFFRENGTLYRTTIKERLSKISVIPVFDINHKDVFQLPLKAYQAEWFEGITKYEAPDDSPPSNVFMKTARLMGYDPTEPWSMASRIQPEIIILERIKADKDRRHADNVGKNIVEYYGCTQSSDGVFIAGICLKRYPRMLAEIAHAKERFEHPEYFPNLPPLDPTKVVEYTLPVEPNKVIEGLIKGLQYLHGLSIIHNDINPSNIMFDEDGHPIIIDLNISLAKGEEVFGGTFGWMDERSASPTLATEDIDLRGLYRVVIFMHENFTLDDLELPPNYDGIEDNFSLIKGWLAGKFDSTKAWFAPEG